MAISIAFVEGLYWGEPPLLGWTVQKRS